MLNIQYNTNIFKIKLYIKLKVEMIGFGLPGWFES
jgi:hypothetical protein